MPGFHQTKTGAQGRACPGTHTASALLGHPESRGVPTALAADSARTLEALSRTQPPPPRQTWRGGGHGEALLPGQGVIQGTEKTGHEGVVLTAGLGAKSFAAIERRDQRALSPRLHSCHNWWGVVPRDTGSAGQAVSCIQGAPDTTVLGTQ